MLAIFRKMGELVLRFLDARQEYRERYRERYRYQSL